MNCQFGTPGIRNLSQRGTVRVQETQAARRLPDQPAIFEPDGQGESLPGRQSFSGRPSLSISSPLRALQDLGKALGLLLHVPGGPAPSEEGGSPASYYSLLRLSRQPSMSSSSTTGTSPNLKREVSSAADLGSVGSSKSSLMGMGSGPLLTRLRSLSTWSSVKPALIPRLRKSVAALCARSWFPASFASSTWLRIRDRSDASDISVASLRDASGKLVPILTWAHWPPTSTTCVRAIRVSTPTSIRRSGQSRNATSPGLGVSSCPWTSPGWVHEPAGPTRSKLGGIATTRRQPTGPWVPLLQSISLRFLASGRWRVFSAIFCISSRSACSQHQSTTARSRSHLRRLRAAPARTAERVLPRRS